MLEDLEPFETLDLPDGGTIELEITNWKLGEDNNRKERYRSREGNTCIRRYL